ncbi:MAG TPA: transaldolase [Terriglobia bacterium]|nr:transaldolase [Terriglobia bacterium]
MFHDVIDVKIFADGAELPGMLAMREKKYIKGFTTNPTLMRKAGIANYEEFARSVLAAIPDLPISFEVFADDLESMAGQAHRIAAWGENVYVKIPVTTTGGISAAPLIRRLAAEGIKQNVTALMTLDQVQEVTEALRGGPSSYISVFAGRIADSGRDPLRIMTASLEIMRDQPQLELIWASPREILNVVQANEIGCHIITVTNDLLAKLPLIGKDLTEFSRETVQMFHNDAMSAGFTLDL